MRKPVLSSAFWIALGMACGLTGALVAFGVCRLVQQP